ncbi:MAG TPA: Uma2 family endonuclease [Thermomicrobiales bacterium]|jgi:Uma2 family endonuclease
MTVQELTLSEIESLMLSERGRFVELHRGQLREKPSTSESHNIVIWRLVDQLVPQLDRDRYQLRLNMGRVRRGEENYYIPDLYVVPIVGSDSIRHRPYRLEVFDQPLPLIVEAWSPSTGGYDVDEKLPEYLKRGDREIWRPHYEFTLTTWRRQSDGEYAMSVHRTGTIEPIALPGVVIDLDALFA